MDVDSFWELVEQCRRQAEGREARLLWLRDDLSRRPLTEIVEFQLRLDQVTGEASTWGLVAAMQRIFGGWGSDDDFDYFRLWMVGLGRDAFERAVIAPDALAEAPDVLLLAGRSWKAWGDDWPGWELLGYVASEAYGLATGDHDECGDAFYAAVEARQCDQQVSRGLSGESWNVRNEDEAFDRLPRLSAMFQLRANPRDD